MQLARRLSITPEPGLRSSRSSSRSAVRHLPSASGSRAPPSPSSAARTARSVESRPSPASPVRASRTSPTGSRRSNLFARKFNCTGKAVQVRRVEAVFEVRFVGVSGASGVGSAVSDDAYATVRNRASGAFVVTMHPAGRDDRADLAFTIVAA